MTEPTTHDLQTARLMQECSGSGDGPDPEPETAEPKSPKQELEELISLIRAHIAFQSDALTFTRQSLAAIRETLAGIEAD
jgi:hypothetical protein